MNEMSLQQKYDFALDYIRALEEKIAELEERLVIVESWNTPIG
jgi:hypothetical protein